MTLKARHVVLQSNLGIQFKCLLFMLIHHSVNYIYFKVCVI